MDHLYICMTQCQDEFRNSSGKTQNLKSPETLKERYRQVRILDLDDIYVVSLQNVGWVVSWSVGLLVGWNPKNKRN